MRNLLVRAHQALSRPLASADWLLKAILLAMLLGLALGLTVGIRVVLAAAAPRAASPPGARRAAAARAEFVAIPESDHNFRRHATMHESMRATGRAPVNPAARERLLASMGRVVAGA